MTHLSKRKIDKETWELFQDALVETVSNNSKKETKKILSLLLSETEVKMLSKRLIVMYMLNCGDKTDNILNITKVTRQTIGKIVLTLKAYSNADKSILLTKLKNGNGEN